MNSLVQHSTTTKNFGSLSSLCSSLPADRQTGRPADRQTGRPADRQTGRPADRQTGRINWYKQTLFFAFLMICSTFITPQQSYGQYNFSHLDSLRNNFPPDSTFTKNEMIVKFKPGAMDLDQLCFTYETVSENGKKVEGTLMSDDQYYNLRTYLGAQRFYVKDLLTDTVLANFLVSIGADTLSRLTFASPCIDTLSITRHGDTIPIQHHLFMNLHFKNDTSIVLATYVLNGFFNSLIFYASPNYKPTLRARIPNDQHYGKQKAFHSNYTDVEGAWDFERGDERTRVAIIDDGLDFQHCEFLQTSLANDKKVVFGWSHALNNNNIIYNSNHGTKVAGIIGGLTNRENNCPTANLGGIAGVAGGWGRLGTQLFPDDGLGAKLIGYGCELKTDQLLAAVLDAVADVPRNSRYGQRSTILNASWGEEYTGSRYSYRIYDEMLTSAYEQKVLFVSSKNNISNNNPDLPSGGEHNKVFAVSASGKIINSVHELAWYAQWGEGIDILAPSPQCSFPESENVVYTTPQRNPNSEYGCPSYGTSFAAPQVAGISALLHDKSLDLGWKLHPEDFEGILKVAAKDINHILPYEQNYDEKSGWGLVNAHNIFKKIVTEQYELKHYTLEYSPSNTNFEPWSNWFMTYFDNSNSEKCIPSKQYQVRRRKVNYTITHSYTWLDRMYGGIDYKIYVWGNGGDKHTCNDKKGFNFTGPIAVNYQTGYTGVNSGYGNCFEWNMIHDYAFHGNNSHKFEFSNYQYEVQMPNGILKVPEDNMLAAHYSVFARRDPNPPNSVRENINVNNIEVYPSITDNQLTVRINNPNFEDEIIVLNTFGTPLLVKKVAGTMITLDVSQFSNGTYFVVNSKDKTNIHKFIILK